MKFTTVVSVGLFVATITSTFVNCGPAVSSLLANRLILRMQSNNQAQDWENLNHVGEDGRGNYVEFFPEYDASWRGSEFDDDFSKQFVPPYNPYSRESFIPIMGMGK